MEHINFTSFFGYMTLINVAILYLWFFIFAFAKEWMYEFHTKWFDISKEKFDHLHYKLMAIYKLLIIVFAFVPFLTFLIIA